MKFLQRKKIPAPGSDTHAHKNRIEWFVLQYAFSLFLGSLGLLCVGFLVFFYQFFYTSIRGTATLADTLTSTQKTINLGAYNTLVETQHSKADAGEQFAAGEETIPNPFASR